jgi:chromosome segregation ATPase
MADDEDGNRSYESIAREFEELAEKFSGPVLGKLKKEFEELFEAYSKTHDSSTSTEKKISEANDEHSALLEQLAAKTVAISEVEASKQSVKKGIEDSRTKEQDLSLQHVQDRKEIEEYYEKNQALEDVITLGSGWTKDQEKARSAILEETNMNQRELDSKNKELAGLRRDAENLQAMVDRGEKELNKLKDEILQLNQATGDRKNEAREEQAKKAEIEDRLQDLQRGVKLRRDDLVDRERSLKQEEVAISRVEGQLKEHKEHMEAYLKEYDQLYRTTQSLTDTLEKQLKTNEGIKKDNDERRVRIASTQEEVALIHKELSKLKKLKDMLDTKVGQSETDRELLEGQRIELQTRITAIWELDIRTEKKSGESKKKVLDDLKREKDILGRKLGSSEKTASVIIDLSRMQQNTAKNLGTEIASFATAVKDQREKIEILKVEREKHETETHAINQKYFTCVEELKLQEVQISDLQRKIVEGGSRLKQQQNLYEAVRSDRNLYSKALIESQEEISEMKRRFKVMNHQIEQLKEEIQAKDHRLVKEHFEHHKVEKEKEQLKNELTKIKKQIVSSEQIISNQRAEIQKLNQIIHEADEERLRQQKEHGAIVGERNILQGQLIKRQEELASVYEKIKVHWSALQHGEARYQECLAELDFLRERIIQMRRERNAGAGQADDTSELKRTVSQLEQEVLHEKTKARALSEELSRPLNVHRWRTLESSDPQRFELIKKVQGLQKRIIEKTEEVVEKDLLIQEKEKLYVELKNILGRQPGPEVAEQLSVYQTNLKQKVNQMKAMENELDMYKLQVEEFRDDIMGLADEFAGEKQKYFAEKARAIDAHVGGTLPGTAPEEAEVKSRQ